MRLTGGARIGALRLRRYQHQRHGVVETLTQDTVVYVRPIFGVLKLDKQQQPVIATFRTQKPKAKQGRRLGRKWANHKGRRIAPDKKAVIRRNASTSTGSS